MSLGDHRRAQAEQRVLAALDTLRPEYATPLRIQRLAYLSSPRAAFALVRLTHRGVIEEASAGNQTVYRRVTPA